MFMISTQQTISALTMTLADLPLAERAVAPYYEIRKHSCYKIIGIIGGVVH